MRVYKIVTTREYAAANGLSMRQASRHMAAIGVKTGRGYKAPILATQWAKLTGQSPASVRRDGIRANSLDSAKRTIEARSVPLRVIAAARRDNRLFEATRKIVGYATNRNKHASAKRIAGRLSTHASDRQLVRLSTLTEVEWNYIIDHNLHDDSWEGNDNDTVLYYL